MSGYIGNIPVPQATQTRQTFTATASQTTFNTAGYTAGFVDVYMNGVHLLDGTDFTATNGSDVVLTSGAAAGDVIEVVAYSTYQVNSQNYTGGLTVDNDGATVLTVDRATSDGTIIDVQKNGSTVGSIGTATNELEIKTSGTRYLELQEIVGLYNSDWTGNLQMTPTVSSVDLGNTGTQWDNLFLSGGVYLGGTGSANKLDDYETGVFIPSVDSGGSSVGYDSSNCVYVKTGNLVHCQFEIFDVVSPNSNTFELAGFPFTNQTEATGAVMHQNVDLGSGKTQLVTYMGANKTEIRFYSMASSVGWSARTGNDLGTTFDIIGSITYRTA